MNSENKKLASEGKKHHHHHHSHPGVGVGSAPGADHSRGGGGGAPEPDEAHESQNKSSEEDSTSGDGRLWSLSPKQTVFHGSRADVHTSRDSICSFTGGSKYMQGKGRSSHGSAGPGGATGGVTGRGGVGAGGTALLGAEDVREEEAEGVVGVPPVPKRMKIIDSLVTYFVFFCSGLNYTVLPQTLVELERFTATDTGRVSVIFTWRGVGFLVGVLGLGHLFDRLHHDLLMGLSCLWCVITHCCIPLFRSIGVLYIIYGCQAVAIGIISVGTTFVLMRYWKSNTGPFLLVQLLLYSIAGIISPFFLKPLLEDMDATLLNPIYSHLRDIKAAVERYEMENNKTLAERFETENKTVPEKTSYEIMQYNLTFDQLQMIKNQSLNGTEPKYEMYGAIFYSNLLVAVAFMVAASCCFAIILKSGLYCGVSPLMKVADTTTAAREGRVVSPAKKRTRSIVKVALFTMLLTLEMSFEIAFNSLLVTFLVKQLDWTQSTALMMFSVLFFSNAVARVLAVPVAKFVSTIPMITSSLLLSTLAIVLLATFIQVHHSVIWLSTIAIGAVSAVLIPTTLAWANSNLDVTGAIASILTVPWGSGLFMGPVTVGYFLEIFGPMYFTYTLMVYILLSDIVFFVTLIVMHFLKP